MGKLSLFWNALLSMAPRRFWIAFRWCPSFHNSFEYSILDAPSPSWSACSTELNAVVMNPPLRASRPVVSQAEAMSRSLKSILEMSAYVAHWYL